MDLGGVSSILLALGIPAVVIYFVRDRRRLRTADDTAEKKAPLEVRETVATVFDTEMAAARKSFDEDRALKDNTIVDQKKRITELVIERDEWEGRFYKERDEKHAVEEEVETLKRRLRETLQQVQELLDTVEIMSEKLSERRLEQDDEDFRLHPGPGA